MPEGICENDGPRLVDGSLLMTGILEGLALMEGERETDGKHSSGKRMQKVGSTGRCDDEVVGFPD